MMAESYSYLVDIKPLSGFQVLPTCIIDEINEMISATETEDYCLNKYGHRMEDEWWGEEETIMRIVSSRHPGIVFRVWCSAYHGDFLTYYKDGKMQEVEGETVYPEFDEGALR